MANINGTSGDDIIRPAGVSAGVTGGIPSDAKDVIRGGAGADILNASGGADTVIGEAGKDFIIAGPGNDLARGRGGADTIGGGDGNDRLLGDMGDDWLRGAGGNDVLRGDLPLSYPRYQPGADILDGGAGDDRLVGFGGADTVFGGGGDDIIVVHDTDFTAVHGGTGSDKLLAEAGLDLDFTGDFGDLGDRVTGIESLDLRGGGHTVTLDAASVLALGSETGKLKVTGEATDTVSLSRDFTDAGQQVRGATTFNVYRDGDAKVWVETGIGIAIGGVPQPATFDVADLDGSNGFVIEGFPGSGFGASVSGAGDINGDGFDDVIIGAPGAHGYYAGESYVVFGSDAPFDARISFRDLDGGNGFTLNGARAYDTSGSSVSGAGDVNGDGFGDLIIGAPQPSGGFLYPQPGGRGESYIVFGSADPFAADIELRDLDGVNGFTLRGVRGGGSRDYTGASVSGGGDVNGDGYDDVIISASGADPSGESYVVFGSGDPFAAEIQPSALDGGNGFTLLGVASQVSNAGDVNGDGYDDLILARPSASPDGKSQAGESYVVFGSGDPFSASIELADLDGANGFKLNGIDANDRSGMAISGAGDINGDGYDDIIIGAPEADPDGIYRAGESYVVFGSSAPFDARVELADLDGGNGFVIDGIDAQDDSGRSVSGAGDVNGDGYDDLIIGSRARESYIVFGSGGPFNANFELSDLDGSNGFVIDGAVGAVSGAGDVTNDGFDDLIIGGAIVFGGESIGAAGALTADLGAGLAGDDPLLL